MVHAQEGVLWFPCLGFGVWLVAVLFLTLRAPLKHENKILAAGKICFPSWALGWWCVFCRLGAPLKNENQFQWSERFVLRVGRWVSGVFLSLGGFVTRLFCSLWLFSLWVSSTLFCCHFPHCFCYTLVFFALGIFHFGVL